MRFYIIYYMRSYIYIYLICIEKGRFVLLFKEYQNIHGIIIYFSGFQTGFLSTLSLYKSPVEFVDVKI